MKRKIIEWVRRYLPAEILSTITAVLVALLTNFYSNNLILTAIFSAWSETIVFYAFIISRDIFSSKKQHKAQKRVYAFFSLGKNIRNIIIEFGIAEALDTLFVRPFFMYFFARLSGLLVVGIVMGKLTSDVIFYIPTIIAYELSQKHLK